jgi:hypothetical protein
VAGQGPPPRPDREAAVSEPTAADVRAAYPEWEIWLDGDGWWHARLTTGDGPGFEPQARTLATLADELNEVIAGFGTDEGQRK